MRNKARYKRWSQYHLRSLLIAMLAVALLFVFLYMPVESQRRSREWVISQKGRVLLKPDYRAEGAWYVDKNAWPLPRMVVDTLGIDMFASAKMVILDCDEIYDLSGISGLGTLEELYIFQFVHESTDFKFLRNKPRLKKLFLSEWAGIDRAGAESIRKLLPGVEVIAEDRHLSGSKTKQKNGSPANARIPVTNSEN